MVNILITIVTCLLAVAFFTIAERKLMASIQRRKGPNVVGVWGLLQAFADGLKLLLKEIIIPTKSNWLLFLLSPMLSLTIGLTVWAIIPFNEYDYITNFDYSLLWVYAVSSLGIYGIIGSGWASNSKYAFLGSLRSAAQLISYEVSIVLIILPVAACANSFNLIEIVNQQKEVWFCIPLFPLFILFFISLLAEANRAPFDLPEAEAEIVAGYNIEYSSMSFALFFLAEYSNMLWLSAVFSICFLGGWEFFGLVENCAYVLIIKILITAFCIVKVRANYPRYRYDQLMALGWKVILPFSIGYFILVFSMLIVL